MTSPSIDPKALTEAQKIMDLPSFKILEIEKQGTTARASIQYKHNIISAEGIDRGSGYAQWEKGDQTHYLGSETAILLAEESTQPWSRRRPPHRSILTEYRTDEGGTGSDVAKALFALIMDKIHIFEDERVAEITKKKEQKKKKRKNKTWKVQVKRLILRNGLMEKDFTIQEFINLSDCKYSKPIGNLLKVIFPNSNTVKASVLGSLQKLRDDGFLVFLDNKGTYKVSRSSWYGPLQKKHSEETNIDELSISSDDEEFGSFVRNYHSNEYRRGAKKPRPTNHIIAYGYGIEGWI